MAWERARCHAPAAPRRLIAPLRELVAARRPCSRSSGPRSPARSTSRSGRRRPRARADAARLPGRRRLLHADRDDLRSRARRCIRTGPARRSSPATRSTSSSRFVAGWAILLDYVILIAIASLTATELPGGLLRPRRPRRRRVAVALAIIAFVAYSNIRGFSTRRTQRRRCSSCADSCIQLAGDRHRPGPVLQPADDHANIHLGSAPTWSDVIYALTITTVAFTSLESAAGLVGEVTVGRARAAPPDAERQRSRSTSSTSGMAARRGDGDPRRRTATRRSATATSARR